MKNTRLLLAVILSGVFLFSFFWLKEKPLFFSDSEQTKVERADNEHDDRARLRYDFNEQANSYFLFTFNNVSRLSSSGRGPKKVTLSLGGGWCVSPSRIDQYSWKIDAHFQALTIFKNDIDPLLRNILAEPFSFEIDSLGYMDNFRFSEQVPEKFRLTIINIAKNFQFILPYASKNQWKTIETDGTGSFHARYTSHSPKGEDGIVRISKEKYGIIDMDFGDNSMEGIDPGTFSYESSDSKAAFDEKSGWISEVEISERITSQGSSPLLDHQLNHFSASLRERQTTCQIPDVDRENVELSQGNKLIGKMEDQAEPAHEPPVFTDVLDSLVELWGEGDGVDIRKAEDYLRKILETHPEISAQLIEFIDSDGAGLSSDFVHTVCLVMADVGGEEIQRNFAHYMTDESMGIGTRIKLVLYANDFQNPQGFLADNLLHIFQRPRAELTRHENSLSNMAILAFGNLGSKDTIDESERDSVTRVLNDLILIDSSVGEKVVQLNAAGNFQNPALAETIKLSAAAEHPSVRKAANEALMSTKDPETQFWVLDNLRLEQNGTVIEGALNALARQDIRPEVNAEVIRFSQETGDDAVLQHLVKIMGNNIDKYENNREVLLDIYARNPGSRVKREIFKFIQP